MVAPHDARGRGGQGMQLTALLLLPELLNIPAFQVRKVMRTPWEQHQLAHATAACAREPAMRGINKLSTCLLVTAHGDAPTAPMGLKEGGQGLQRPFRAAATLGSGKVRKGEHGAPRSEM